MFNLTKTHPVETTDTGTLDKPADMVQVILWNDDHNEAGYVVRCLMQVFKHETSLATKIMLEAHEKGKAIAEVEGAEAAGRHKQQLQTLGLTATIERL